jgi:hypothetical protein
MTGDLFFALWSFSNLVLFHRLGVTLGEGASMAPEQGNSWAWTSLKMAFKTDIGNYRDRMPVPNKSPSWLSYRGSCSSGVIERPRRALTLRTLQSLNWPVNPQHFMESYTLLPPFDAILSRWTRFNIILLNALFFLGIFAKIYQRKIFTHTTMFLDIIYRSLYISKHSFSETGFCLRLQSKRSQLDPIETARDGIQSPKRCVLKYKQEGKIVPLQQSNNNTTTTGNCTYTQFHIWTSNPTYKQSERDSQTKRM